VKHWRDTAPAPMAPEHCYVVQYKKKSY
jgi:hypothetical protein